MEQIESQYDVTIIPSIGEPDETRDRSLSAASSLASGINNCGIDSDRFDDKSGWKKLKLRPDWSLILNHPKFQLEYKELIRNYIFTWLFIFTSILSSLDRIFGTDDITIRENEILFKGIHSDATFFTKTREFIEEFACETFDKLRPNNISILQANSTTAAFICLNEGTYKVATKSSQMSELRQKMFSTKKQPRQTPMNTMLINQ